MRKYIICFLIILCCSVYAKGQTTRLEVISLRNDTELSGGGAFFIIGSVWINEREYVLSFVKSLGRMRRLKMPMKYCVFIEDENNNPYVIIEWGGWSQRIGGMEGGDAYFHIPEGTIIRRFELE